MTTDRDVGLYQQVVTDVINILRRHLFPFMSSALQTPINQSEVVAVYDVAIKRYATEL